MRAGVSLPLLAGLLLPLTACGGGARTLEGSLADSTAATEAWVTGSTERTPIGAGAFRIEKLQSDSLELHFARGKDEVGRMRLTRLPGGTLRLEGIWFEDGRAFPGRIASPADHPVVVNGLRMAAPAAVPDKADVTGTVLALNDDGTALIVRPDDAGLPDLDVFVTPATKVSTPDGDPVEPGNLQVGDSLHLTGTGRSGYVVALSLTLPRKAAISGRADPGSGDSGDEDAGGGKGKAKGRGRGKR
jgi:hypothetical protein